jgi:hypothetical protein
MRLLGLVPGINHSRLGRIEQGSLLVFGAVAWLLLGHGRLRAGVIHRMI